MEVEAIFRMVKESFYEHRFTCDVIISDDDSTIKSNLKHSYTEKVEKGTMKKCEWPKTKKGGKVSDNGRLPLDIPEPEFLADFNHRVETVGKEYFALVVKAKKKSMVDTKLATRLKYYEGSMLRQIRYMNLEDKKEYIRSRIKAPVEHVFGNHAHCDSEWCYVLKAQQEGKTYQPEKERPFFDKQKDTKIYM